MSKVLVTGATGNVGREVVRALVSHGVSARAADRSTERMQTLFGDGVERAVLDFHNPTTFLEAARGCTSLFLLRPPAIANVKTTLNPFVDAARSSGIDQVVFLSVAGAGTNKIVPHHAVEVHLAARNDSWTVLRPGFFAQNLGDAYRQDICEDHRLYVPAGRGQVAFVDVRDVAEIAVLAFLNPEQHRRAAYTLTGPEAVSFEEAARLLSECTGHAIRYESASIPGYLWHLAQRGMPLAQAAVQTILHVGLRFGQAATVDPTLCSLLGRRGRTLSDYVHDHVALWNI